MKSVLDQVSHGFFARDIEQAWFAPPRRLRISKAVRNQAIAGIAEPVRHAIDDSIRDPLFDTIRAELGGVRHHEQTRYRRWPGLSDIDVQRIAESVCEKLRAVILPAGNDSRYWSPERAAHECSVSKRTFAQWMADGKIRIYTVGGRVLIDPKVLEEDLAKYQVRRMPKRHKRRT